MGESSKISADNRAIKIEHIIEMLVMVAIIIFSLNYKIVLIRGYSMFPTLRDGQIVLIHKNEKISSGDIVVIKQKYNDEKYLIKRVIGVGGDSIEIKNGEVYINGIMQQEQYIHEQHATEAIELQEKIIINQGEIFVMGDNRQFSADSRVAQIGNISTKNIVGKIDGKKPIRRIL